jgi:predicted pyridoxine 5'-phosphate oxidase superfamily flavin-nucleotide-binding protein
LGEKSVTAFESMYHEGQRALQERFDGRRVADALEKHRRLEVFNKRMISMIESATFFFLATAHGESVDCSFKGGPRGFVRVTGPTTLEWPDFDGNSMYRSLGNIMKSPSVGLLFMKFGKSPARFRVNGKAKILYEHPRLYDYPGAKMMIHLDANEIFPNCPRYIPDLEHGKASPYVPKSGRRPNKPAWKGRSYIKGILPENDPH